MFLSSLLQYAIKFVLFAAVALAGIFIGVRCAAGKMRRWQQSRCRKRNRQLEEICCEKVWSE